MMVYSTYSGEAGTASTKAKADMQSTVQGHLHITQAYCQCPQ